MLRVSVSVRLWFDTHRAKGVIVAFSYIYIYIYAYMYILEMLRSNVILYDIERWCNGGLVHDILDIITPSFEITLMRRHTNQLYMLHL